MNYNFSTLNDKDLEDLAHDVLTKTTDLQFQSFKMGKDQGIDLRYASNNDENEIIVQVKHYFSSNLSLLKSDLKKKELSKIVSLNPKRYILVTSLGLTPKNKEELKQILHPYVLSTQDIMGRNDLNNIIRNDPDIETTHFKLWLSSATVLKRILHNGINGRSEFIDNKIKDRIKIFVPNRTHDKAVELLNKNNFILVTGAPGIGKTTLANILTYQLLANGFELIYVREIKEAEDAFVTNRKQVFYFDDFLGSITLDLHSSRNADSAMVQFLDRVRNDKTKKLILTCRTYILQQAKGVSEKISESKIDLSNHEVKIEDYSPLDKAKILYNHIYFSSLPEDLKRTFFEDSFYWDVINHRFYNPRVIEAFTDPEKLQAHIPYKEEVIDFLDDPSKIWYKPYTVQISAHARLLLNVLYSLGGKYAITEDRLKAAFIARYDAEVQKSNLEKVPNVFNKVVSELNGGFIGKIIKVGEKSNSVEYKFFNPSIEDFLFQYFTNSDFSEYLDTLGSAIYFEQFRYRISTENDELSKRIYFDQESAKKLLKLFLARLPVLSTNAFNSIITSVAILIRHFNWESIKTLVVERMNSLRFTYLTFDDREDLVAILNFIATNNLFNEFSFSVEDLLYGLSKDLSYHGHIEQFSELIEKHDVYLALVKSAEVNRDSFFVKLQQNIESYWEREADSYFTNDIDGIIDKDELVKAVTLKKEEALKLSSVFGLTEPAAVLNYTFDYELHLLSNRNIADQKVSTIRSLGNDGSQNETLAVNRLFNASDSAEPYRLPF